MLRWRGGSPGRLKSNACSCQHHMLAGGTVSLTDACLHSKVSQHSGLAIGAGHLESALAQVCD